MAPHRGKGPGYTNDMRFLNKPSWTQIILPLVFCFHSAAQGQYGERGDYGGGGDGFLGWLILGGADTAVHLHYYVLG